MFSDRVELGKGYYLTHTPGMEDLDALVENLNDIEIYNGTLKVPFPYTRANAVAYVSGCLEQNEKFGVPMKWQVRTQAGRLAGSISLHSQYGKGSHKDEIGYWMGKAHRNQGIMTQTIKAFSALVFEYYGLVRLEATIFDYNISSQKVVEKCGFIYEGTLKKAYFKDGKYIDGKLYSLLK
ncbi:MAG TPA: GNAT family protein [Bacteroidia bacterium]|jgi:RimJ/RimL family protein N-acetyltransferase